MLYFNLDTYPTVTALPPDARFFLTPDTDITGRRCTRWHLALPKVASYATQDGILCSKGKEDKDVVQGC